MNCIHKIHETLSHLWAYVAESFFLWWRLMKYNASFRTDTDKEKMQYSILRENHVLEKGMSLRNPRRGFGQSKVTMLLRRIEKYIQKYGTNDTDFLSTPMATIGNYVAEMHTQHVAIQSIEELLKKITESVENYPEKQSGGVKKIRRSEIIEKAKGNFESLLFSRHSSRIFSTQTVASEIIEEALRLSQQTPSACNRQAWKTHVFIGSKSQELVTWQGGCRGFESEVQCAILVTSNQKAFLSHEPHQAYVDGGMYAMNLINSLHFLGLATIPISCGFSSKKLKGLRKFGIPENESPIVIIGVGHHESEYQVAVSQRKKINETNLYH